MNKLAQSINVSQSTTDKWKKGYYPSADTLIKLCQYLNVSADYLLELDPPKPPPNLENLEKDEKILIEYYRKADERGQENIINTAEREASRNEAPSITSSDLKTG